MNDRTFLSVFTPSRTAPEDLEAIFVQRQAMLDDAVERVRESATTGNKHHLLFVGPRGTGKTHLVTLLVHRLGQDEELKKHLNIAWLNEDETSTTLLEFLRRIYLALVKRYPDDYSEASLEPIYDLEPDAAEHWLANLLLEQLKDRTLLVVVENLDALFEGLGEPGQQRLRALIQEHPVLTIVATAQRLVDDITKRNSVFFGFFQTEQLVTLSVEEAAELLGKIATLNGQPDVAAFLHSPTGRARIRALHHLSGGNHRIYIVLSQFITRDNIDALVGPFSKMIDEMTPYYQERIRWLPAQQRKIVEYLCTRERPTPVKELAKRLFASHQTISSQLKDLRDKGYVQSAQRGRESLYEIAEPLMRICVEVKENQTSEPMRLLVDFLRVWYDARDLTARLQGCDTGSIARAYLQAAIEKNSELGDLRAKLLVEGFRTELGDEQGERWLSRIESYARESEELALACGEWAKGNKDQALSLLAEIADESGGQSASVRASACLLAGEIYFKEGAFARAIEALYPIFGMSDAPVEQVARALYNRGWTYGQLGESEKEIADYSAVIALPNAPVEPVARALFNRGWTYRQLGESEKALADYSAVIALPNAPVEQVAMALYSRGWTYWQVNDAKHSEHDFEEVRGLIEAPIALRVEAHFALAKICIASGRWDSAISVLAEGLAQGASKEQPYVGDSEDIIAAFFESTLTPGIRRERTRELVRVYRDHNAIHQLGEALTRHLGSLYRTREKLPASDNLELWASAWEEAGRDIEAFRVPLRIFRTGIDFLKAGGKDLTILLDLNQEERRILEQALALEAEP